MEIHSKNSFLIYINNIWAYKLVNLNLGQTNQCTNFLNSIYELITNLEP